MHEETIMLEGDRLSSEIAHLLSKLESEPEFEEQIIRNCLDVVLAQLKILEQSLETFWKKQPTRTGQTLLEDVAEIIGAMDARSKEGL